MDNLQLFIIIAIMSITTFALRAMPFIFRRHIENNQFFLFIKNKLPAMMMLVLVFYAVGLQDIANISSIENLDKKLIALSVTVVVHWLLRNFLLSIGVGAVCYIVLL